MTDFGRNLSEIRKKKGYTQKTVADGLRISQSAFSQYEKGEREPSISKIIQIIELFDISADELFGIPKKSNSFYDMLDKLDEIDRAEISGTVKQMLKNEKYNK